MSETGSVIHIQLNGKPNFVAPDTTVSALLQKWKVRPELVTVEVNEQILQKLDYDQTVIRDGDRIEFVFYMGGGAPLHQEA